MKHVVVLMLLFSPAVLLIESCKGNCENPHIYRTQLLTYDSSRDRQVRIITYEGGNNFTSAIDSTEIPLSSNLFQYYFEGYKDYKIILLPENKTHLLRDIHFGNEKGGYSGKQSDACSTSASYVIPIKQ